MPFRAIHGAKREFMAKSIHDALHQFIQSVALLRLGGFLHALRLYDMTVLFYHHNKIRLSGFYFTFLWKISSTQWISPVKDGFHCEATALP